MKILDIIAKLQAKAEGTDNEEEKDAFHAKAERMMLKHAIEQHQVDAFGKQAEPIVKTYRDDTRVGRLALLQMLGELGRTYGVFYTFTRPQNKRGGRPGRPGTVSLYGMEEKCQAVYLMWTNLKNDCLTRATVHVNSHRDLTTHGRTLRLSFIEGYCHTVNLRLEKMRREVHGSTGTDLVLRDEFRQMGEFAAEGMDITEVKGESRVDRIHRLSFNKGCDAAFDADLGHSKLGK